MLAHINNMLGAEHAIPTELVKAFSAKGISDVCQNHVILDRLEARLRTLDKKRDGVLVREWEGTWASDLLQSEGFEAFQTPYEDANGRVNQVQKKARKILAD
jgi:hypothetical protein